MKLLAERVRQLTDIGNKKVFMAITEEDNLKQTN